MKKIMTLLLALALVLGTAILPSPVLAKGNSNEFKEADYKVEKEDGRIYKVYEFTDLVGTQPRKDLKKSGGVNTLRLKAFKAMKAMKPMQTANPALGEETEYSVDVQWTTYDLQPGDLGFPLYFQIRDKTTRKFIAQTDNITAGGVHKFYKLPAWNDSDVSHDPKNWNMRAFDNYKFDVRLKTGANGHLSTSDMAAQIVQRSNPIYRAEYYTNKTNPTIKVQRTNKNNETDEVSINSKNLGDNEYYSWAKPVSGYVDQYYDGKKLEIAKEHYGNDTLNSLEISEEITAGRCRMKMKAPGKTEFDRGPGTFEDNGTPYHYEVTGDHIKTHIFTIRQDLKVNFDANKGTWKSGNAPEAQTIGHSMKLGDSWAGLGPINVPKEADLKAPAVDAGKPEKKFIGWNTDANATEALFTDNTYATPITKDETFYAIYAEKAQGIAKVKFDLDGTEKDASEIDAKYKIEGQDYPAELKGNLGEKIADAVFDKTKAPKFIGYKIDNILSKPVPPVGKTANYTENGEFRVIYKYKKLDPIIPAKDDNGNDNPKVTPDVKATYKPVTIKVDSNKGKFQKNSADVTGSEFVYYVNPVEGKNLNDVLTASGLTAVAVDENKDKIDTTKPWKFDPTQTEKTKSDPATDFALTTVVGKDNVKDTGVTMEVNFKQTTADKFKDKLDHQDIKVWVGDTIDWKKGVKLKEANEDLQKILDKAETKVTDESNRNSDAANLPKGQKGDLKVTFEDGSSLDVKDQTLYVAPHKNDDNTNLPKDAVKVEFKIGDGVTGTAKTEYVKPGTDVKGDAPAVGAKEGFKDAKWYKDEATTEATANDYKVTANAVFTAKATGKDKVVKLDDPENPTNFPKDPTDNSKKDADYVTVKFVADANGKIKENGTVKEKGIAYAVLKNTEWADAVKGGVVVPTEFEGTTKFYTFKEWQKDGTKVTEFAKVGDADVTYTAVFGKADEFSVTYKLNAPKGLTVGGNAPTDTDNYLKDDQVTVKALAADNKLAGYKFTGWNTQADGKGTAYAAGAKFAIKANTELFAQWEKTAKDVIPVDNENDEKGKNGEEIPTNYVFVEFKVKDTDADKAEIKANQQAKFKVDPKATVTLTAPELVVKDASYTAKFNQADYTNKKFAQATTIWAVVAEKGKVTVNYVFKTDPADKTLPKALADLKPENITTPIYEDKVVVPALPDVSKEPEKSALVESVNGEKVGTWSIAGNWEKSSATQGSITYTLTWKFTEPGRSLTPSINPVKPDDKTITGKGEPGSEVKVTIPGVKDPIKVTVDQNGDWTVEVPNDIHLKDGDKITATQKTKDLKESYPAEVTVQRARRGGGFILYPVTPVEPKIETAIHKAYIFGYEDSTFRPEGNMTRAEAAAMLARLQGLDTSNDARPDFVDVRSGWYNAVINAVVNAGYMKGYPDGTFRPDGKITRAEFAQMIKSIDKANTADMPFADAKGHWAEPAIAQAYANGRITGYPDGTFRPDNQITRAEAVTVFNKLYDRSVDAAGLANVRSSLVDFNDTNSSHWAYYQVIEASNTHEFYRTEKGKVAETWVKIIQTWKDLLARG
ncbi:S-layer homology domain-containing protein [Peptoniphilus sp. EMRHCC_23]|uniref:S-layer homology domain-containing protein n=1 Tax=Peptoniphilus rachelemmaiella TaxID=2811779 RepID=UPI001C001556|nr:S-layer homology domain-containing protein [Peptoniphilus rachelemmaiella]